jgi:hypothetical protein
MKVKAIKNDGDNEEEEEKGLNILRMALQSEEVGSNLLMSNNDHLL